MENSAAQRLRIVIAGGSGQIGRYLASYFQQAGHRVIVLTRAPYTANWPTVFWDGVHVQNTEPGHPSDNEPASNNWAQTNWVSALEGSDILINLSGHSIACADTRCNRQRWMDSRILSTRALGQALGQLHQPPRLWLNASAVCPGTQQPDRPPMGARGFLARMVNAWEHEFFAAATPQTRKVALRSALFLAPEPGNPFALLSTLVRAGIGGTLGSGKQFVSWIHAADYARAVEFLIEHPEMDGPINLAAPEPIANRAFMAQLREAWDRPNGVAWPSLLLYLASNLRADAELALFSCHALPLHLERAGFRFNFPDWPSACHDLAHQWRHYGG